MDRRGFLSRLTAASAAVGLEVGCGAGALRATRRVIFQVRGFTCITCAVGLEVMLRGVRGVTEASANYAESSVRIAFDEQLISEDALKQFIGSCGFLAS
jgi:copper chaperone CopZ